MGLFAEDLITFACGPRSSDAPPCTRAALEEMTMHPSRAPATCCPSRASILRVELPLPRRVLSCDCRQPALPAERLALYQDQVLNAIEHRDDDPTGTARRQLAVRDRALSLYMYCVRMRRGRAQGACAGGVRMRRGLARCPGRAGVGRAGKARVCPRGVACCGRVAAVAQMLMYGKESVYARQPTRAGVLSITVDDIKRYSRRRAAPPLALGRCCLRARARVSRQRSRPATSRHGGQRASTVSEAARQPWARSVLTVAHVHVRAFPCAASWPSGSGPTPACWAWWATLSRRSCWSCWSRRWAHGRPRQGSPRSRQRFAGGAVCTMPAPACPAALEGWSCAPTQVLCVTHALPVRAEGARGGRAGAVRRVGRACGAL